MIQHCGMCLSLSYNVVFDSMDWVILLSILCYTLMITMDLALCRGLAAFIKRCRSVIATTHHSYFPL